WKCPLPVDIIKKPRSLADWIDDEFPGVADVYIDSLKDVVPKLSDDEVGSKYNTARQELLARGHQVAENHHQRKEQRGQGKPNNLADVYGSRWLTAGAGSIVLLWGEAGDVVVDLTHLKAPVEEVGPLTVIHDHRHGHSTVETADSIDTILARHPNGLTVAEAAR